MSMVRSKRNYPKALYVSPPSTNYAVILQRNHDREGIILFLLCYVVFDQYLSPQTAIFFLRILELDSSFKYKLDLDTRLLRSVGLSDFRQREVAQHEASA